MDLSDRSRLSTSLLVTPPKERVDPPFNADLQRASSAPAGVFAKGVRMNVFTTFLKVAGVRGGHDSACSALNASFHEPLMDVWIALVHCDFHLWLSEGAVGLACCSLVRSCSISGTH